MVRAAFSVLLSGLATAAFAQPNPSTTAGAPPNAAADHVAVVAVPIPISNEAIGSGIGVAGGLVFNAGAPGSKTPPSIVGGGGGYTNSHTWLAAGAANLMLGDNRWRVSGAYGQASLHYRWFGTGTDAGNEGESLPIDQTAHIVLGETLVRTAWQTFLGARYLYLGSTVSVKPDAVPPLNLPIPPDVPQPGTGFSIGTHLIAVRALRDTRNDRFWPTAGSELDFTGGGVDARTTRASNWFQTYQASGNWYVAITPTQTIAARAMACGKAGDQIPFFQLCQFGLQGDLRGYETGRYRDRVMFATQAEYRLLLPWRLAIAAFGGVGEVAPRASAINTSNVLPAGGIGLRFSLSKEYRVNYRVDYAVGKNGGTWIVSLGEAF
jgi:hypothetical protein